MGEAGGVWAKAGRINVEERIEIGSEAGREGERQEGRQEPGFQAGR